MKAGSHILHLAPSTGGDPVSPRPLQSYPQSSLGPLGSATLPFCL